MSIRFRSVLMILMSSALFFGFLHLFVPEGVTHNFERLHIFLFNLCSGGTIVLYFTENQKKASKKVILFCLLAVIYAILAFFEHYIPAMLMSLGLAFVVETVRVKKFTFFPVDFFKSSVPVSEKFHQASLLCLSIGLVISCLVILNNNYLGIISFPKLKLDTFFLGFSFPLSLITMSVMFSFMRDRTEFKIQNSKFKKLHTVFRAPHSAFLKNAGFWSINLGVIIFFLFILFEKLVLQLVVTTILFLTVIMIFYLFCGLGVNIQQKNFLASGMGFLLFTSVTGILYIILEFFPEYYAGDTSELLLKLHSFASLYGWNLSGLAVICRHRDFPIRLHSNSVIIFHWITVLVLAPMGIYFRFFAICAIFCYTVFLYLIFSSKGLKLQT
ncbi:hypothetical protein [Desulfonema magnum]|uniref:Uncharacterized protein n=1 Tax=Desulfonema magnum TaxID=45655 RepID=A0A975GMS8_9BACT|nr:hypothetical protein [Desulfonema magnum]QTA86128.1 Uncharacterized protein dnm_021470 [Desulfonema magnum]